MLRLAFDLIITWRETRTRPNAYSEMISLSGGSRSDALYFLLYYSLLFVYYIIDY